MVTHVMNIYQVSLKFFYEVRRYGVMRNTVCRRDDRKT